MAEKGTSLLFLVMVSAVFKTQSSRHEVANCGVKSNQTGSLNEGKVKSRCSSQLKTAFKGIRWGIIEKE